MKSVVFVSYSMGIGGVEKALLGVCNKFIDDGWEVYIALIKPEGEFLKYLPDRVNVRKIDGFDKIRPLIHTPMKETVINDLRNLNISHAFQVGLCLLHSKIGHGAKKLYKYAFKEIPYFSSREFDLAVAFAGPDSFIYTYTQKRIKAKEKWGWIHFDISKFGIDRSIISCVYKDFSRINVVSEQAKTIFDKHFPQFAHKTCITPNIVDEKAIIRLANDDEPISKPSNRLIILTVGRVSAEKGQYRALKALKILIERGVTDIQWWFVGEGSDFENCKKYVITENLTDYAIFFGAKTNPYPYMKACDVYIQPSEHEGFCITLHEARVFEKPIITTEFTGAAEQLSNYTVYHSIVPHDEAKLADAILKLKSILK